MSESEGNKKLTFEIFKWCVENRELVRRWTTSARDYLFFGGKEEKSADPSTRFLIIGPGGVGKSTTAKTLAGQYEYSLGVPREYEESLGIEEFALQDDADVSLVVPPGQAHRRDSTWNDIEASLSNGEYRGIIVVNAYGYHSLGDLSLKAHPIFKGDPSRLADYLADRRKDELRVIERLVPHIRATDQNKLWMLNLVNKRDLWWEQRDDVIKHYQDGKYGKLLDEVSNKLGTSRFRVEYVYASLTIANFVTGQHVELSKSTAGYGDREKFESLLKLLETLFALKQWDEP